MRYTLTSLTLIALFIAGILALNIVLTEWMPSFYDWFFG